MANPWEWIIPIPNEFACFPNRNSVASFPAMPVSGPSPTTNNLAGIA